MDRKYLKEANSLMDFLEHTPSQFHAVANMKNILKDNGFSELSEERIFSLERGRSYYISRNSSALIAFRIPEKFDGIYIAAAHTDSPTFRIKENPDVRMQNGPTRLNVEGYGGMIMSTWFDKPLSIAGRIFIRENGAVIEKLIDFGESQVVIPSLAIHQNRDINNGYKYSVQNDLLPIFSDFESERVFSDVLAEKAGCNRCDIIGHDLFLYNRTKPQLWGLDSAFISAERLDDLECAYTAISALAETSPRTKISMCALFDNEEVGSGTKQGALSDFLENTIQRIFSSLKIDEEERYIILANSRMVSADNAHAVHPAFIQKSDITNRPRMNGGVVIKYSANQKYTTDGESSAFIKNLMDKNGIPSQYFFNNSDVPGGSTLGNLSTRKISLRCVDIGAAQLAMHSSYETAGTKDVYNLKSLFKVYLEI